MLCAPRREYVCADPTCLVLGCLDLLLLILSCDQTLCLEDLCTAALVSRAFRDAVRHDDIWLPLLRSGTSDASVARAQRRYGAGAV